MNASVVICGGGTGGHVTPGLAVAGELRKLGVAVAWLGVRNGIEERLVPADGLELHTVDFHAPHGGLLGYANCVWRLPPAVRAARRILEGLNAKAVLGLGGYPSLPGLLAGRWLGIRCLLHEQNVNPGLANRVMAPWMHSLLTSNPLTFAHHDPIITGNPVRPGFDGHEVPAQRAASRDAALCLLVLGGSQGARSLNEGVPAALARTQSTWVVAHAAGRGNIAMAEAAYGKAGVEAEIVEFMDDVPDRLMAADLVVCRGGASTIAELACVGVAAIIVPYPHGRQHQDANAAIMCGAGAVQVLADNNLTQLACLLDTLADRKKLVRMGEQALAQARPQAAHDAAQACQKELQGAA